MYAKIENNNIVEYPLYEGDIKLRFPTVSWETNHFVAPAGYVAVKQTNIPAYNWDQTVVEKPPVYIDNQWTQQWAVVDLDPDKKQEKLSMEADGIRAKRNRLLSECDWTQLPDVTLDSVKRTQWNQYRQSLRDITSQPGFPLQINWPISP